MLMSKFLLHYLNVYICGSRLTLYISVWEWVKLFVEARTRISADECYKSRRGF